MRAVTLVVAVAAFVLALYLYGYSFSPLNAVAPVLVCGLASLCFVLVRQGHTRWVPHLMVFGVMIGAVIAVIAHGSIRATGVSIFVAVVTGAGIFLGRQSFFTAVTLVCLSLVGLFWAEMAGLLNASHREVDFSSLLTLLLSVFVTAVVVFYSRTRSQEAHERLHQALQAHRRTEAERDRNLRRFERMFQSSPTPMIAQSAISGVILDVNPAFERVYGYAHGQVVGRVEDFLWADGAQREVHRKRLFSLHRITEQPATGLRADGTPFEALVSSELSTDRDDQLIISNVIDISDKIRHETLLMEMAQGMTTETGEAFFHALSRHMAPALNADAVMVSEKLSDRLMRTLSIWQHGERLDNLFHPIKGTPCQSTLRRHGLDQIDQDLADRFAQLPPALSRDLQTYAGQSLRDEDGSVIGVLAAFWRQPAAINTERQALMAIFSSRATAELIRMRREREIQRLNHTLEERVRVRTAELEKLNAELDSFSYSVSHDLKSPLRAIDGFTRLLADELSDRLQPHESQLMQRVIGATQRMSILIADLLALARVSQGALEPVLTDLSQLAEEVLLAEREKHPQRALQWEIEPGLHAWCDARLARIALENLLGNAVKYTRDAPSALIRFRRDTGNDAGTAWFCIQDNGVGFDMAYADKLFKPFQRLHQSSDFDGTGIGLATVRRIVERHGGGIGAHSTVGQGSTFRFHFGRPPGASAVDRPEPFDTPA